MLISNISQLIDNSTKPATIITSEPIVTKILPEPKIIVYNRQKYNNCCCCKCNKNYIPCNLCVLICLSRLLFCNCKIR